MALTREAFLSATVPPSADVPVPELGAGEVISLRGMTAKQRQEFEKKFVTEKRGRQTRNFDHFREHLIVVCATAPTFSEADIPLLSQVRADVIERVAARAAELSGITEKDIDELGQASAPMAVSSSSSSVSLSSSVSPSA